jgi:adenosylcobinamide-GDP ribazoletransferase
VTVNADAARLAVGTFTVIPVRPPSRVDQPVAERALVSAPVIGALLGALAAGAAYGVDRVTGSSAAAAVAAVAVLAALTRGLHLDGLADVADGLGSRRRGAEGVAIMRRSDIGPFGIITLVLVLLADAALIAVLVNQGQWVAVPIAAAAGRVGCALACSEQIPAAVPDGLGAAVAGSVRPGAAIVAVLLGAAVSALGGWIGAIGLVLAMASAAFVVNRCSARFGGITGDVLGAVVEVGTLVALIPLVIAA